MASVQASPRHAVTTVVNTLLFEGKNAAQIEAARKIVDEYGNTLGDDLVELRTIVQGFKLTAVFETRGKGALKLWHMYLKDPRVQG